MVKFRLVLRDAGPMLSYFRDIRESVHRLTLSVRMESGSRFSARIGRIEGNR